jgi:unspecific monooxygenase
LYLLSLAPDVQARVAEEGAAAADAPALDRLPFTRAVVDEAMRLYPPAYVIVRAAREPDEVCGVPVARGDLVVVSPWVLHRHKRLWRDPGAFDPQRFLPGAPASTDLPTCRSASGRACASVRISPWPRRPSCCLVYVGACV